VDYYYTTKSAKVVVPGQQAVYVGGLFNAQKLRAFFEERADDEEEEDEEEGGEDDDTVAKHYGVRSHQAC